MYQQKSDQKKRYLDKDMEDDKDDNIMERELEDNVEDNNMKRGETSKRRQQNNWQEWVLILGMCK